MQVAMLERICPPHQTKSTVTFWGMLVAMPDIPPCQRIWANVNKAIEGEEMGPAISSILNGLSQLVKGGLVVTEDEARAHLAAICLSPAERPVGSLGPLLAEQLDRLRKGV